MRGFFGCVYLVRNSNGAILGGFAKKTDAMACKRLWDRMYGRSPLARGIRTKIERVGRK